MSSCRTKCSAPRAGTSSLSRRLVESYHESVIASGSEPLYHAFSDRYGGTKGIPFATRREALLRGIPSGVTDPVQWCVESADAAAAAGDICEARRLLQAALEFLCRGARPVARRPRIPEGNNNNNNNDNNSNNNNISDEENGVRAAAVLRRSAQLSMRQGEFAAALEALTLSSRADPLTPATYALRAACYERLGRNEEAHSEYDKYLSLSPPSVAVLVHAGHCALCAGHHDAAERHLQRLLRLSRECPQTQGMPKPQLQQQQQQQKSSLLLCDAEMDLAASESPQFCEAHAYYCLGRVHECRAADAPCAEAAKSAAEAQMYYTRAASHAAYVAAYESAVETAMADGDAPLALENIRHLQRLFPECAAYHTRAADVCAVMGDTYAEVEELSRALDQQQSVPERRATLLRRANVHATKLRGLDEAIVDLSLLLSLPGDDACTARAHQQRAHAFQQRAADLQRSPPATWEDAAAALRDYDYFVIAALREEAELPCEEREAITEAMLILANGAFAAGEFNRAASFFARATARGWQPREQRPQGRKPKETPPMTPAAAALSIGNVDLLTKMYIALAHTVVERYPVSEEMFRIAYEVRERTPLPIVVESRKSKATEKKEAEKPSVVVPAVGYQMVDEHYQRLRALEPTVFSALQNELLDFWEMYRTEVERFREDLMLVRSGKKVKRR